MNQQTLPLLIFLCIASAACISKKSLLETSAAYETRLSLVRDELMVANRQIQALELQLAEKKGENNALSALQGQLQAKIEALKSELQNSSSQATKLQTGLSMAMQSKDSLMIAQKLLLLTIDSVLANRNAGLEQLMQTLQDSLQVSQQNTYGLILEDQQLRIVLDELLLFKPGITNKVEPEGKKILRSIASVLAVHPQYFIWVVGHHDNQPVPRKVVSDEWDYTVLRAAEISRTFVRDFELDSGRITAAGKGQFAPLMSNQTKQGQAKNRRIEIVIFQAAEELPKALMKTIGKD
ncbi:MAG: OmpA/MotB family protein [Saprospiraceae bacterium]|jgi:chemotaxis protein MotB